MALTIENASIGFDANNVEKALNHLNSDLIDATIQQMNNSMAELREYVDNAWVGESAETFKANMEHDKDDVTKGLHDAYDALRSAMYEIVNNMQDKDKVLVEKRG